MEFDLTAQEYTEKVDMALLQGVIAYATAQKEDDKTMNRLTWIRSEAYKGNGTFKVKYKKNYDFGRVYPFKTLSLSQVYRPYRHTLCRDYYYDIDLVNAQPTILYNICLKNDIHCPMLADYVKHRDKRLLDVMVHYSVSKDIAKSAFIGPMNNGSIDAWQKKYAPDKMTLPYLKKYEEEMKKSIIKQLINHPNNAKLYKEAIKMNDKKIKEGQKEFNNPEGTFMSQLLGEYERTVLQIITKYIMDTYKTNELILCHDGLMIPKHILGDDTIDSLIKKLINVVSETYGDKEGFKNLDIKNKAMNEGLDIKPKEEMITNNDLLSIVNNPTHENGAKIFVKNFVGEIFYSGSCGFIMFDKETNLWDINVIDNVIKCKVSEFYSQMIDKQFENKFEADIKLIEALGKLSRMVGSSGWTNGVIDYLKGSLLKEGDKVIKKLQTTPSIISFSNGICYDFNLRSARQITKEDYQTQTTGYPWKDRDDDNIQLIKEFVNGLHDNEEMTQSLLSCLSCALYGENKNEKFFVWTGNGRNGKGTIETIFKNVLGNYYHALNPSQLTSFQKEADKPQPELAKLRFTRGIVSSEPEESETFKISVIKKWTGRDPLTARTLNKEPFTFNPQFTPYILCNTIPVLSDMDGGIAERLRVIPFNFSFTGEEGKPLAENQKMADINIKEKIRDDKYKYGLLHLLIEMWHKYDGKFYECEAITKATLQYFEEQNTLKAWFFENYKIDEMGKTSANDIFIHYQKINKFIGHKKFGSELKKICPSVRVSTGIKYKCIRLCEWEDDKECLIEEKEL